jgi:hypothetical protein
MSLHAELLDTAGYLLRRNQNRPTQADIRRCISTAYYALFHRLIEDAVSRLITGEDRQAAFARAYDHGEMREACRKVLQPPKDFLPLAGLTLPAELRTLAALFVRLQEERHDADYNRGKPFVRAEARQRLEELELALEGWERVRTTPAAETFLLLLLLGRRVSR